MALPNTPFATRTAPQMVELDQTFAAVAALGTVSCTAVGTNSIALTPGTAGPTISAYFNHLLVAFVPAGASTGAVTAQVSGLPSVNVYIQGSPSVQAGASTIPAGVLQFMAYNSALNSGNGGFQLLGSVLATAPTAAGTLTAGSLCTMDPYTLGATQTTAHGLAGTPTVFTVFLKCIAAGGDVGYALGDEVQTGPSGPVGSGITTYIVYADATNININTTSGAQPAIPHKSTHTNSSMDPAKWSLNVRGFYVNP